MTETMKRAFAAASRLSPDRQDDLARYLLALSESAEDIQVSAEEAAAIAEAEAEIARGEHVSEQTVKAFWQRNGV